MTSLSRFALVALFVAVLVGCGGTKPGAAAARADTSACCDSGTCARCSGSDSTSAICETSLDTTPTGSADAPPAAGDEPGPAAAVGGPAELPRLWDFGSTTCIPCRAMEGILEPMIADYKDKVDVRIIDVYKEKDLARQFKIVTIPTQVFIDATGVEIYRHVGVYPRDSIESCFKKFSFPVVTSTTPPARKPVMGGT